MGTAGHIDHGKTTLIKALTGIDCDRLKDEKKRGITIELGFAYLDLPNGVRLSIVDVPGHEKFVKNMVAGAMGIDFVLLTVAADEGIMPQTREHIEICKLLGIEQGIVAITKIDMVDEELLELAIEDVKDYLKDTFLKNAPIIPVSSHTGEGIDALTTALLDMVNNIKGKKSSDIFVLPIDRVFTLKGHGTVITGTLVSGEITVGERVMVYPDKKISKVRHIQVHGETVEKVGSGRRTAINLANLEVDDIRRGEILARPDTLFPSLAWDVKISCLSSSPRPILNRKEVHFHHGTIETLARIYLLDRDKLEPGEQGYAQVKFSHPMVGLFGDRFVIRSFSPLRTIGGGEIINPLAQKIKRYSKDVDILKDISTSTIDKKIILHLKRAKYRGLGLKEIHILTNENSKKLKNTLNNLLSRQEIFIFDREEEIYIGAGPLKELINDLIQYFEEFHKKNPTTPGLPKGQIISDWGKDLKPKLVHFVIEHCIKKKLISTEDELLRLPHHKVSLNKDQTKLKQKVLEKYKKGAFTPPGIKVVAEELGIDRKELYPILKILIDQGDLIKVKEDLYFFKEAIWDIENRVRSFFEKKQEMRPQDFKELTGLSRKYSIPLLEYFDKQKLTIRVGDVRKLRKK